MHTPLLATTICSVANISSTTLAVDDKLCAAFIWDARSDPSLNKYLDAGIYCISTL